MNRVEYRAARRKVLLGLPGALLLLGLSILPFAGNWLTDGHFRSPLLELLPPGGRAFVLGVLAMAVAMMLFGLLRLLINPLVVTIDDDGIAVVTLIGTVRGLWQNYYGHRPASIPTARSSAGQTMCVLKFANPGGRRKRSIPIPGYWGLDRDAIFADAMARISKLQATNRSTSAPAMRDAA